MYLTSSERPLQSILCPGAVQWVMEFWDLPLNLTTWLLVGSSSASLAVELHIRLKFECSIVFWYPKADVDELLKDAIKWATASFWEAASLAPIYWELVLRQLHKGIPVDWSGMAYVPDDVDDRDLDSTPADAKSKTKPRLSLRHHQNRALQRMQMAMPMEVARQCHGQDLPNQLQKGTDHRRMNVHQSLPPDKLEGLWRVTM